MVAFGTRPRSPRRTIRDAALPALRLPAVQRRLAGRMAHTLVAYPEGPLTRPARIRGLPRPGTRMPDVPVGTADGERSLYAVLRRGRHVLLVAGGPPAGLAAYRDRLEVVRGSVGRSRGCVLVRPDGYVAAVGVGADGAAVREYLRELVRPTPGPTVNRGVRMGVSLVDRRASTRDHAGVRSGRGPGHGS
jgi:hypothetical protein